MCLNKGLENIVNNVELWTLDDFSRLYHFELIIFKGYSFHIK